MDYIIEFFKIWGKLHLKGSIIVAIILFYVIIKKEKKIPFFTKKFWKYSIIGFVVLIRGVESLFYGKKDEEAKM